MCNIIENSKSNNGTTYKIDKKKLAVEILTVTFKLTAAKNNKG